MGCMAGFCDGAGGSFCSGCYSEFWWRSDLTCCQDEGRCGKRQQQQVQEGNDNDSLLNSLATPKIGRCEWQANVFQCPKGSATCVGPDELLLFIAGTRTPITGAIEFPTKDGYQLGNAWGTCYLNSDSAECVQPLCGQMTITAFQGSLSLALGYGTARGTPLVAEGKRQQGLQTGQAVGAQNNATLPEAGRGILSGFENSALAKKLAARRPKVKASAESGTSKRKSQGEPAGGQQQQEQLYYPGIAFVLTTPVQVTGIGRSFAYTSGMMQYVWDFFSDPVDPVPLSAVPTGAHIYHPFTYSLALTSNSAPAADEQDSHHYDAPRGNREEEEEEYAEGRRYDGGYSD